MNRTLRHAALAFLLGSTATLAQSPAPAPPSPDPAAAKRAAIEKVAFLIGEWEGEGSVQKGPGKRARFRSWERVEPRLGGQLLVIDGRHTSLEEGEVGKVIHEAFATLSWDERKESYSFRTQTADGRDGDFAGRVENGAFVWTLPTPQGTIRYTLLLDPQGRWSETGEMSTGGTTWRPFFEMTLTKGATTGKP